LSGDPSGGSRARKGREPRARFPSVQRGRPGSTTNEEREKGGGVVEVEKRTSLPIFLTDPRKEYKTF